MIKSGYLVKKSHKRKNWNKRWFVLRESALYYYKDSREYELLDKLPLQNISRVMAVAQYSRHNVFAVITKDRTYYLQAESLESMNAWIQCISKCSHPSPQGTVFQSSPPPPLSPTLSTPFQGDDHHIQMTPVLTRQTQSPIITGNSNMTSPNYITEQQQYSNANTPANHMAGMVTTTTEHHMDNHNTNKTDFPPIHHDYSVHLSSGDHHSTQQTSRNQQENQQHNVNSIIETNSLPPHSENSSPNSSTYPNHHIESNHAPSTITSVLTVVSTPSNNVHYHQNFSESEFGLRIDPGISVNIISTSETTNPPFPESANDPDTNLLASSSSEDSLPDLHLIEDNRAIMSGYLLKLSGKVNKTFRPKWFVLRSNKLYIYKNDKEYVLSRLYDTSKFLHVLQVDPMPKHPFIFKIVSNKRNVIAAAKSREELHRWIEAIQKCTTSR